MIKYCSLRLNREVNLLGREGERLSNNAIGALGEGIAGRFIQSQGGKVIYRNYRGPKGGELDLVVRDGGVLCFVEVKTRTKKTQYRRPMDAVDVKKRRYIIRGAHAWLNLLNFDRLIWRYDVVEVILLVGEKPQVNWVKQAFTEEMATTRSLDRPQ